MVMFDLACHAGSNANMPEPAEYIRIADLIEAEITAGTRTPGSKFLAISEMATQYDVSVSTIKMVYVRLEARDKIVRRQGKGVFVAGTPPK